MIRDRNHRTFLNGFASNDTMSSHYMTDDLNPAFTQMEVQKIDVGHQLIIKLKTPNYKVEDIEFKILHDRIVVKGQVEKSKSAGIQPNALSVAPMPFEETIMIPESVDAQKVTANFRTGVVTILMPRS